MQVQAYKVKASTSVKVVTITFHYHTQPPRTTDFDASITEINLTNRLPTSIVDENDKSQCFNHRDELDSTVQVGRGTRTRIACIERYIL